jgi:hypothetical protein
MAQSSTAEILGFSPRKMDNEPCKILPRENSKREATHSLEPRTVPRISPTMGEISGKTHHTLGGGSPMSLLCSCTTRVKMQKMPSALSLPCAQRSARKILHVSCH